MAGMDGIIGMGYSTISINGVPTPFENMLAQGLVDRGMFAFYFSTIKDGTSPKGSSEIIFGGYNPDRFTGPISWYPVINKGYWEIGVDNVLWGDKLLPQSQASVVVDTGTR
jgi:saccharopepsin